MWPEFANPLGMWALLAVPVVLAIHFLQQKRKPLITSTLFLIETLAPSSQGGRSWDRLRSSRALWLQLLAVLLAAWVLLEPRWVRENSAQTVAVVLDSSASMAAFRTEAEEAVTNLVRDNSDRAAETDWVLMTTDPHSAPLYRGTNSHALLEALNLWQPGLGTHDVQPALRLAQTLAGGNGLTWFVCDERAKVPTGQSAIGVGRPLVNVGFVGANVLVENGAATWRAFVKNNTDAPQTRPWWVEAGNVRTPERMLELAPGALLELSGSLPAGVEHCFVVMKSDEFATDDRLPLIRPMAKSLPVRVDLTKDAGDFFRKVLDTVDGVTFSTVAVPRLQVVRRALDAARPASAAIILPEEVPSSESAKVLNVPVVVKKHPLLNELNWQGLLGPGPGDFAPASGDEVLLWQNERPLAWLSGTSDDTRSLVLNFEWNDSNAARLPAAVLLLRRYAEHLRDAQPGGWAANFDCGSAVSLSPLDRKGDGKITLEYQPADGSPPVTRLVEPAELAVLRAPAQPGFFVVRRDAQMLVSGAAHFADPRQADFRRAETFATGPAVNAKTLFLRNTLPDPFTPGWLALIGLCLLGSWWPRGGGIAPRVQTREAA